MGRTVAQSVLVGILAGLTGAMVLHLLGVALTPAVIGGTVGGAVGAVASGSSKSKAVKAAKAEKAG